MQSMFSSPFLHSLRAHEFLAQGDFQHLRNRLLTKCARKEKRKEGGTEKFDEGQSVMQRRTKKSLPQAKVLNRFFRWMVYLALLRAFKGLEKILIGPLNFFSHNFVRQIDRKLFEETDRKPPEVKNS